MRCYNAAMKVLLSILMAFGGIGAILLGAYRLVVAEFDRNAWPDRYGFDRLLGWSNVGAGAMLLVAGVLAAKRMQFFLRQNSSRAGIADHPSPRRRFQFSLRTLLIAVTLLSLPLGWIGWQVRIVQHRKAIKEMLRERNLGLGGLPNFVPPDQWPTLPWYRTFLGDDTWPGVYLDGDEFTREEVRQIKEAFPDVKFLIAQEVGFRPYPKSATKP